MFRNSRIRDVVSACSVNVLYDGEWPGGLVQKHVTCVGLGTLATPPALPLNIPIIDGCKHLCEF